MVAIYYLQELLFSRYAIFLAVLNGQGDVNYLCVLGSHSQLLVSPELDLRTIASVEEFVFF